MKRTDAALTAELVSRLGNHDQMKKLGFSSPLNVRSLTFLAIDGFGRETLHVPKASILLLGLRANQILNFFSWFPEPNS
jgi:hypothetical protein